MSGFLDLDVDTDPQSLLDDALSALEQAFPGWVPRESNLEVRLAAELLRREAETREVLIRRARSIFDRFGAQVLQVPRGQATAAIGRVEFTAVDDAGYNVPGGTLVGVELTGDELVAFATDATATINVGETTVEVDVTAEEPGEDGNGLTPGSDMVIIDSLPFLAGVELVTTTGGGQEEEDEAAYLDRLTARQQLSAPRPILPADFEVFAREVDGVHRALALNGYDPSNDTDDNPRLVAIAAVDPDGIAVPPIVQTDLEDFLEDLREVNFEVAFLLPTYTGLAVEAVVRPAPGVTDEAAEAAAEAAIIDFLDPGRFAGGDEAPPVWRLRDRVRFLEVAAVISAQPEVDFLEDLQLDSDTVDVMLAGRAPLPAPLDGQEPSGYSGPVTTVTVSTP